jgi:signal transduction histidine kinase
MNFSDALASSIHDIKNSLSTVLIALDELVNESDCKIGNPHLMSLLRQEAHRANNNLIQLLSIYKLDGDRLDANVEEYNLEEFLDEIVAENLSLVSAMEIGLTSECDPAASGFFDENLVRGVLNHALGNAERYAHRHIQISGCVENDYTVFRVEDDGDGFPDSMIDQLQFDDRRNAFTDGHTQLGLYFASAVAALHRNREQSGFIRLRNRRHLSGGCFELWLP